MSSTPFLTAEALDRGFTRGRLSGPQVRQLFPGVHVDASTGLTLPLLVSGARRLLPPDALASDVTAIRMLGVPAGPLRPLRFVTTHPYLVRRQGLLVSRATELPPATAGVLKAPFAFVRSASTLDLVELVAVGDRLVRLGLTTPEELTAVATAARGRGVRAARAAAGLVRARVDSAQETELRLCLVLAGLPEPECNPLVGDELEAVGRADMRYRELGVLLEYEGDQHRTDRWQWNRDIERQEQFTARGLTVVRLTAERMRRPRAVVARVLHAMRAGGYLGPDPVFSAEWCALFSSSARLSRLRHAFEVLERTVNEPG